MNNCVVNFKNYNESIAEAFCAIGADKKLAQQTQILIKPNCVDAIPYPVTTPPECISALIDFVRSCAPQARIIVAEGCGCSDETDAVFEKLGYTAMCSEKNVELIDLNHETTVMLSLDGMKIFKEYHIPEIAMNSCIVSVPVLKAHSLADVTLSLKNMMGFAPPKHYQRGGFWKKSFFHANMHQSIIEMNMYRKADLTLIDATTGMAEFHLGGAQCKPPANKLIAGFDPVETDKIGAELLGFDWRDIPHIADMV